MATPKRRLIAINGSAGAFTDILSTIPCSYMEIREDDGGVVQGLQVKTIEDGFTNTYQVAAGNEPFKIGQQPSLMPGRRGSYIGVPAGYSNPNSAAMKLASVLSKTATATNVWVIEYQ